VKINLVTNIRDGKGLLRDAQIIEEIAKSIGHDVKTFDFRDPPGRRDAALAIHFEVYAHAYLTTAMRHWIFPNPEWWYPNFNDRLILDFEKVLCKTRYGHQLFADLCSNSEYVGFQSHDIRDESIKRARAWIHVAGGSTAKGTKAILDAWDAYEIEHPLVIVGTTIERRPVRNVHFALRLPEEDYRIAMNTCLFHIQPSETEGFGHVLHEALSVGCALVTSDWPPMSEITSAITIPIEQGRTGRRQLAQTAEITPRGIHEAVSAVEALTEKQVEMYRVSSREEYEGESSRFRSKMVELLLGERK